MLLVFSIGFTANAMMPHFEEAVFASAVEKKISADVGSEMHANECEDVMPHDFCSWGFCHWGHCSFNLPLTIVSFDNTQAPVNFMGCKESIYENPSLNGLRRPPIAAA